MRKGQTLRHWPSDCSRHVLGALSRERWSNIGVVGSDRDRQQEAKEGSGVYSFPRRYAHLAYLPNQLKQYYD